MMVYSRRFLIAVCILQFISTVEWQVFNFLGYMWAPILACFVHFVFILVGFFGAVQYRPKCAIVYLLWLLLWIGMNVFIICIYLEVGILKKDSLFLNFGLGNKSWWFDHGLGCTVNSSSPAYSSVRSPISSSSALADVDVSGCLLHYTFVEILHAAVQIFLALLGLLAAICLAYVLRNDEDSFSYIGNFGAQRGPCSWGTTIEPLYFTLPVANTDPAKNFTRRSQTAMTVLGDANGCATAPSTPAPSRSSGPLLTATTPLHSGAQPVKSSELEFISMRHSSHKGHPPHQPLPTSRSDLNAGGAILHSSSSRRLAGTPPVPEFDTLVTQVDTLSPHHSRNASHESLQPMPPQRLSANRLLREAHLGGREEGAEEEEDEEDEDVGVLAPPPPSSSKHRSRPHPPSSSVGGASSSRRHRRHHGQRGHAASGASSGGPASSYAGADSSLDRRSVFSRDSQRPREPLPWVVAAPLLSDLGADPSEPQPPPYSSQPPSVLSGYRSGPPQLQHQREPPSPAPYRPPRPSGAHSPYENWRPPATAAALDGPAGYGTYENAWSPVPPLQPMMTSPISAEEAASSHWSPPAAAGGSRGGVIFFRSNTADAGDNDGGGGSGGGGGGLSFGGSVVV